MPNFRTNNRLIFVAVWAIAVGSFLAASNILAQESKATKKMTFRCLLWAGDLDDIYFLTKGKSPDAAAEPVKVRIYSHMRSEFYYYKGLTRDVTFFRETGKVDEDGNPIRVTVAHVRVPDSIKLPLFLFKKDAEDHYAINVLEDHPSKFPPGTFKVCNLCPATVGVTLGTKKSTMKPGKVAILPADFRHKGRSVRAEIGLIKSEEEGGYQRIYSNGWNYTKAIRTLVFIVADPLRKDAIACRRVQENGNLTEEQMLPPEDRKKTKPAAGGTVTTP